MVLALRSRKLEKSIRILFISERELLEDFKYFPDRFNEFVEWHKEKLKNGIKDNVKVMLWQIYSEA